MFQGLDLGILDTFRGLLPSAKWARLAREIEREERSLRLLEGSQTKALVRKQPASQSSAPQILRLPSGRFDRGTRQTLDLLYSTPAFYGPVLKVAELVASVQYFPQIGKERIEPEPGESALWDLWESPNEFMDGHVYRSVDTQYRSVIGEEIDIILKADNAAGFELFPVNPVDVKPFDDGKVEVVIARERFEFRRDELYWRRSPDLRNLQGRGIGFGKVLASELVSDENAADFAESFFRNHARPDFMLFLPGGNSDDVDRFKKSWRERYEGPQRNNQPVVFGGDPVSGTKDVELIEVSQRFVDTDSIDFRKFMREVIWTTQGIPPEIMGLLESSNKATIEAAETFIMKHTIDPIAQRTTREWNKFIAPMVSDGRTTIGHVDPTPADTENRREIMKSQFWGFTVNEHRASAGFPPRDDGDVYLRPPILQEVSAGDVTKSQAEIARIEYETEPVLWLLPDEPARKAVSKTPETDADLILLALSEDVYIDGTRAIYDAELERWAGSELNSLGVDDAGAISGVFGKLNPLFRAYVANEATDSLKFVDETTRNILRPILVDSISAGDGPRVTARKIRESFGDMTKARSNTIARTEMLRASNYATWQTQIASGLVGHKRWLTTVDGNERDTHFGLNGQERSISQPFTSSSGDTAQHPGAFSTAAENVNCRCSIVAAFPEVEAMSEATRMMGDAVRYKAFVDELAKSEQAYEDALTDVWDTILNDELIPALERVLEAAA